MGRWIISRKLVACATCAVVAAAGVVVLSPYVSVKDEKPISSDVDKEMVAEIVWRTRNADGLKAYERHDYDTALKLLRPLAEEGDAEALYVLGTMYQNGMGVLKDGALASHWFALARRWRVLDANKGDRAAQMRLAIMLELGQGGAVDLVSANMWFNIAASAAHERGEKSVYNHYVTRFDQGSASTPRYDRTSDETFGNCSSAGTGSEVSSVELQAMRDQRGDHRSRNNQEIWL